MPGVRTGTWYSASWRSCSPTGGPANSPRIVFPGGLRRHSHRSGAHTAAARRGARWTREVSQFVRIFYKKFLTLSKIAYTKFSAGPPDKHNPLSQQKEFRAIKTVIIQEAAHLRFQLEDSFAQTSTNPTLAGENTLSAASHQARLPSEYLLSSSVKLFHQMRQVFHDTAAPPSNPMGICVDSKRRKNLMQKRVAIGHKQDAHGQSQSSCG